MRERPDWAPQPVGPAPALYPDPVAVTIDEVCAFARTLPRTNEGLVRDAWIVGDETFTSVDFGGYAQYGVPKS